MEQKRKLQKIKKSIKNILVKNKIIFIFILLIVFIASALLVGASYYLYKEKTEELAKVPDNQNVHQDNTNSYPVSKEEDKEIYPVIYNDVEEEIEVDWYEWPIEEDRFSEIYNSFDFNGSAFSRFLIYKTGKVTSGEFEGKTIYTAFYSQEGPGRLFVFRAIGEISTSRDEVKLIALGNYSDDLADDTFDYRDNNILRKYIAQNNKITILDLDTPERIQIPNTEYELVKEEDVLINALYFKDIENPEKVFEYKNDHFVYKYNNCFYVKAEDGLFILYNIEIGFLKEEGEERISIMGTPHVLDITWTDGEKNTNEYYVKKMGGCGMKKCFTYTDIGVSQLRKVGESSAGEIFYELKEDIVVGKDYLNREGQKILENMYKYYYPGWDAETKQQKDKIPYEEFLADYPIIFWQDPFGDFIIVTNAKYVPAVECGKPVIYLYPEKEMDISVKVYPNGGFSITEPEYNGGWNVLAKPNGELYNYADETNYPYLFWEGKGAFYETPEKGFVIERENVKNFLIEKLNLLGLNEKETNDFLEFWYPRMQEKPYYFITFVPKEEFDAIAPLDVSPKPDTIIRVFMDYKPLDSFVEAEEPILNTPLRNGFTVVEWGGALR